MRRLCLMVRAPELGQVKTRLAASVGEQAALSAYTALVDRQLSVLDAPPSVRRELWCAASAPEQVPTPAQVRVQAQAESLRSGKNAVQTAALDVVQTWATRWRAELAAQEGQGLGERMLHCLQPAGMLPKDAPASTLVIGADVIGLSLPLLEQAWDWLEHHPGGWLFVPADDGGYGLIGYGHSAGALSLDLETTPLAEIAWGTSSVMAQTRERCRTLGLLWTELGSVWDVDTEADWRRYQREAGVGGS